MIEVTDNIKTLDEALERIETLETQKAHLLNVIKERKLAGYVYSLANQKLIFTEKLEHNFFGGFKPVYYISDEYDATGILITPEVKIES